MNVVPSYRLRAIAALGVALTWTAAPARAADVSTLAGSGVSGFEDGPRASATFAMPTALAYDRAGNLLVVDTAAQRIRRVLVNGTVETLAGSGPFDIGRLAVRGGFADGPGRSARFNWPRGIAVMNDGTVMVADTGNHCIRAIAPNGDVTVYAGSPQRAGHDIGPRRSATFGAPTGLSTDTDGNLYVADPQAGVRKIDPSGTVTEIGTFHAPVGVSVAQAGTTRITYVTDADGLWWSYSGLTLWRLRSDNYAPRTGGSAPDPATTVEREIAMQMPLGHALGASAMSDGGAFFADPRRNEVTYTFPGYERVVPIAGSPSEGRTESAGFRDGPAASALFNMPAGTALKTDGTQLAVADTGNRRIRLLSFDPAHDLGPRQSLVPYEPGDGRYNVLYLGNSFTWYDSTARDGIGGLIAQYLDAGGALTPFGLKANVRTFGGTGTLDGLDSLIKTVADIGTDDAVILSLNSLNIETDDAAFLKTTAIWQPKLIARLKAAHDVLTAAHIRFYVVLYPIATEISANEIALNRTLQGGMVPKPEMVEPIRRALAEAGVDVIDTYPDFIADAARPDKPVSNAADSHYTPYGRTIMARSIVRQLERFAPWKTPRAAPR